MSDQNEKMSAEEYIEGRVRLAQARHEIARGELQEKGRAYMASLFEPVLKVPGIKALRWYQFTPTFNDGDPCMFTVGELEIIRCGDEEPSGSLKYLCTEEYFGRPNSDYDPVIASAGKELVRRWSAAESILLDCFGDNTEITVAMKDGTIEFDAEEYYCY